MARPGIVSSQTIRSTAANNRVPGAARWFIAFQSDRGSAVTPTRMYSMYDFEAQYGTDVSYGWGWKAANAFFNEGGGELWGIRVLGTTPVKATATLVDRAGSPLSTLTCAAASQGAYANGWKIVVAAATTASPGVKITIQDSSGNTIESADNLATPAAIAAYGWLNVTFTNLGSATASPNNLPAINTGIAPNLLASGTDDRGTIVGANYVTAVNLFTYGLGAGKVSVPGISGITAAGSSTVGKGLKTHALSNRRWAIIDTAQGDSETNAKAVEADVGADANGKVCAVFWPWLLMPDGTLCPPSPGVAGKHANVTFTRGAGNPAAGQVNGSLAYLTGVDPTVAIDDALVSRLNVAGVNTIYPRQGRNTIFGWRTASTDTVNYYGINIIDVLNAVQESCETVAEAFLFRSIDGRGHLLSEFAGALIGVCDTLAMSGTLYALNDTNGRELDPGYAVETGPSVNTPTTLANNELRARVSVRPSPFAELITLEIIRAPFGATLS